MSKVTGIKSVDFKITAYGYGVVNWNGPTTLVGDDGKQKDNHTLPKLRGYTNLTGQVKDGNGYKYKKHTSDINFKETPLYISQNCIRHHLFRDQSFDLHYAKQDKKMSRISKIMRGQNLDAVLELESLQVDSPLQSLVPVNDDALPTGPVTPIQEPLDPSKMSAIEQLEALASLELSPADTQWLEENKKED